MSIQSVDRALQILALFSHRCPTLGVTEISQAVGLSKGTVHGLIRTLLRQGFLQQDVPPASTVWVLRSTSWASSWPVRWRSIKKPPGL